MQFNIILKYKNISTSPDLELVGRGVRCPLPRTLPPPWPFVLLPVTYSSHILIPG